MREWRIQLAFLNVVTQPHSPEGYKALFRKAFNSRITARLHGDRHGLILELHDRKITDGLVTGVFGTYLEIDKTQPWLSTERLEAAEEGELEEVVLPTHLKPNLRRVAFVFSTENHRLAFNAREMGPSTATRFVRSLLTPGLPAESTLDVTIEQDHETLKQILSAQIERMSIVIRQPNPRDLDPEFEKQIEQRMRAQAVREVRFEYKAAANARMRPDQTTQELAKLAASNGEVKAEVRTSDGERKTLNTADAPLLQTLRQLGVTAVESVWTAGKQAIRNWKS